MTIEINDSQTRRTVYATWMPDGELFVPWPLYRGDRASKSALVSGVDITLISDNETPFRVKSPMHMRGNNLNKGGVLGAVVTTELWSGEDRIPGLAEGIAALLALAEKERMP